MTEEEKKAALDALQAILSARQKIDGKDSDLSSISGPITLPVDPELLLPTQKNKESNQNIQIEDPDNVLKQQKEPQSKEEENQSKEEESQPEEEEPQPEEETQSKDDQNANNANSGTDGATGEEKKVMSPEEAYAAGWNEIIDRFDKDEISIENLQDLLIKLKEAKIGSF